MWDSIKNMGTHFALTEWNATQFHISLTITALTFQYFNAILLRGNKHLFSPFQSTYLNFSATKGQVQLQTQDKILSLWKHCGSTGKELVPPHALGG